MMLKKNMILLTPDYCIFCKKFTPRLTKLCSKYGINLQVYKQISDNKKFAKNIISGELLLIEEVVAFPCVIFDGVVYYGSGLLRSIKNHVVKLCRL